MSSKKSNAPLIGAGVAACAVCCAGPILAVLAAIGVSTGVGYALFGVGALAVGAAITAFVVLPRRRRSVVCSPNDPVESFLPDPTKVTTG